MFLVINQVNLDFDNFYFLNIYLNICGVFIFLKLKGPVFLKQALDRGGASQAEAIILKWAYNSFKKQRRVLTTFDARVSLCIH